MCVIKIARKKNVSKIKCIIGTCGDMVWHYIKTVKQKGHKFYLPKNVFKHFNVNYKLLYLINILWLFYTQYIDCIAISYKVIPHIKCSPSQYTETHGKP